MTFEEGKDEEEDFAMRRKSSFSRSSLTRTKSQDMYGQHAEERERSAKLWCLMKTYIPPDVETIQKGIINHIEYTLARTRFSMNSESVYRATAYSIRDRLIESVNDTNRHFHDSDPKRCYYLSLEYLTGRAMQNALVNLDIEGNYKAALHELGLRLEDLYDYEHDAALGNGGLGRLAACFLDSMATLQLPCWAYGLRYTYGIFEQKIVNSRQVEHPDYWLVQDNPWEICRHDVTYAVRLYGSVKQGVHPKTGEAQSCWVGGEVIQALAYDTPVPGYDTYNTVNLRLWKAIPSKEFDFESFSKGRYLDSIRDRQRAESICAVLYPTDDTYEGKELRLKQEYFFVCATLQDILRRFRRRPGFAWSQLPSKVAAQLNDTHPALAIPELMRLLVDVECLEWQVAWDITRQVFSYTNHTVLPESLEKWPVQLMQTLLPRHMEIINLINFNFLNEVRVRTAGREGFAGAVTEMSIYEEGETQKLRMANLAVIGSHCVNGVAVLHSRLVQDNLFRAFTAYFRSAADPAATTKFLNVTNGVTPRRWIHCANRPLSELFTRWLRTEDWLKDAEKLRRLERLAENPTFVAEWRHVKRQSKTRLAAYVRRTTGVDLDPDALFDIQVKRIHEYKRQLLNCLHLLHRYLTLKGCSRAELQQAPRRAAILAGKSAPGYAAAKSIITLANKIAHLCNNDAYTSPVLKVVFVPNYNVSAAEALIPGGDVSQHISLAGTEASGTGNMKSVMNGGLLLGTEDGANVEIKERAGAQCMFSFGVNQHEVEGIRAAAAGGDYPVDPRLQRVFEFIRRGQLTAGDSRAEAKIIALVDSLTANGGGHCGDPYLVCRDFPAYCDAQDAADEAFRDQDAWARRCITSAANMGHFTTDRAILEYASKIWRVAPCPRPEPMLTPTKPLPSEVDGDREEEEDQVPREPSAAPLPRSGVTRPGPLRPPAPADEWGALKPWAAKGAIWPLRTGMVTFFFR